MQSALNGWDTDKILSQASPVIDFGQIIIYTNNLKIIRAPMDQRELMRRIIQTEGVSDWAFVYRERRERTRAGHKKDVEKKAVCNQNMQVRENWKYFCFLVLVKPFSVPIQAPSMSVCVTSAKFGLEASLCSFLHLDVTEQHSQRPGDRCSACSALIPPAWFSFGDH